MCHFYSVARYVLNTDLMDWSLKKCKSNPRAKMEFKVTPRAGHTAVLVRSQIFDRGDQGTFEGPALVCFGGQTDGGMQVSVQSLPSSLSLSILPKRSEEEEKKTRSCSKVERK